MSERTNGIEQMEANFRRLKASGLNQAQLKDIRDIFALCANEIEYVMDYGNDIDVRKYNYVIDLLGEIDRFIRETSEK